MEKQRILQRKATLFEERIIFLDHGLEIITKKVKLNQVREMTQEMASFKRSQTIEILRISRIRIEIS